MEQVVLQRFYQTDVEGPSVRGMENTSLFSINSTSQPLDILHGLMYKTMGEQLSSFLNLLLLSHVKLSQTFFAQAHTFFGSTSPSQCQIFIYLIPVVYMCQQPHIHFFSRYLFSNLNERTLRLLLFGERPTFSHVCNNHDRLVQAALTNKCKTTVS